MAQGGPILPSDTERLESGLKKLKLNLADQRIVLRRIRNQLELDCEDVTLLTYEDLSWIVTLYEKSKLAPKNIPQQLLVSKKLINCAHILSVVVRRLMIFKKIKSILDKHAFSWQTEDLSVLREQYARTGGSIFSIFKKDYRKSIYKLKQFDNKNIH